MRDFGYARATSRADAIVLTGLPDTMVLAGGTELLNWTRIGIVEPARIVDITRIPGMEGVEALPNGGVRIGALTKLNDAAQHPLIRASYPVLSEAILKSASAQIRNLATVGGNPLQRVRCPYFRADEPTPCNKRIPGSGCAALHGFNEKHAIFGWTKDCVAVHPADPPVAFAVLDADFQVHHSVFTEGRIGNASFGIQGDQPVPDGHIKHARFFAIAPVGQPAPREAPRRNGGPLALVDAVHPQQFSGCAVQRHHGLPRSRGGIHDATHHERSSL